MKKSTSHIYLIILLSILSSVAPIATDTYLPSIPEIAKYFPDFVAGSPKAF